MEGSNNNGSNAHNNGQPGQHGPIGAGRPGPTPGHGQQQPTGQVLPMMPNFAAGRPQGLMGPTGEDKQEYRVITLNEENYAGWKFQMKQVLKSKNLWRFIEQPSEDPRAEQAMTMIITSISYENLLKVINCKDAYGTWKALESIYENKSSSEKQMLLAQFHSFKITSARDISKSLSQIQEMAARLKALDAAVDDDTVMSIILNALPPSFNLFKTSWNLFNADQKELNKLISCILVEAGNMKQPEEKALYVQKVKVSRKPMTSPQPVNKNPVPNLSKNKGRPNSARRPDQGPSIGSGQKLAGSTCYNCKKTGHWARDCKVNKDKMRGKPRYIAMMATTSDLQVPRTTWIADSGCSVHMTPFREWLIDYRLLEEPVDVKLGDDKSLQAVGVGKICASFGMLEDVHYVPGLAANLFSISSATEHGVEIMFVREKLDIYYNEQLVLTAPKVNKIYLMEFEITKPDMQAMMAATIEDWHEILGHPSMDVIKDMAKTGAVTDMIIKSDHKDRERTPKCRSCALNKCKRAHHGTRSSERASKAGLVLHLDTVGMMKESLGGAQYYLLCKDDYSSYKQVSFVTHKSEIADEVKKMISTAELETKNRVLEIRTDNGTEFTNWNLKEFLDDRGIKHSLSNAYTPEQNGFIEREIQTVTNTARTLMNQAKLKEELWAELTATAVYLLNRITHKGAFKTPYELWFGHRPSVKNLKRVGQFAVILRNQRVRASKWSEKGETVMFVGYTSRTNTFRFYDPATDRIVNACDVVFLDENRNDNRNSDQQLIRLPGDDLVEAERSESDDSENTSVYYSGSSNASSEDEADMEERPPSNPQETKFKREVKTEPVDEEERTEAQGSVQEPAQRTERKGMNIPKTLFIMNRPPQVLESRLRSRDFHHAKLSTIEATEDPKSYKEAMSRSDRFEWLAAMNEELKSLRENKVWELVKRPKANIVTNKWVLKIKRKPDGSIDRYRARLVARGFSQIYGIDYLETYAPVANTTSIRALFANAALKDLQIAQFDVKTAFLYGDLDETVYMEQPEGFQQGNNLVWRLKRSLYGLKQSPRQWNQKFSSFLKDMKLQVCEADSCIFYKKNPILIIAIYVDDGIIFAERKADISKILDQLSRRFKIHSVDTGTFLGFQYYRGTNGQITLHQESYIKTILKRFNMNQSKTVDAPATITKEKKDETPLEVSVPYREAVGSLMYAACTTRVDIAFAVNRISRACVKPTVSDWQATKRIFRYLCGKENLGLTYRRYGPIEDNKLVAYCDSDFAGDQQTSRSTTGYLMMLAGAPIVWKSQRQSLVTLSSTEAEFVSICSATKEIVHIRRFCKELDLTEEEPTVLYCDNQSAIRISKNEKCAHRTRHMAVHANYPREQMEKGEIDIKYIRTDEQLADMLTKATTVSKFTSGRSKIMNFTQAALIALATLAVITCTSAFVFTRVDPLIWIPTDDRVDVGMALHKYDLIFQNPCDIFPHYSSSPIKIEPTNDEQTLDEARMFGEAITLCHLYYEEKWVDKVQEMVKIEPYKPPHLRQKRALFSLMALGGVAGFSVTNFVATLYHGIIVNNKISEIQDINRIQEERIAKQQVAIKSSIESQNVILRDLSLLTKDVFKNTRDIAHLKRLISFVSWHTTVVHNRVAIKANALNNIEQMYRLGKMATRDLARLLNNTELINIRPEDTIAQAIRVLDKERIQFEFGAREISTDTKVYQAVAINHWANLTGTPYLMEYIGSQYLVYNEKMNCAKAIATPVNRIVQEECNEMDWQDPKLDIWRKNYEAWNQRDQYDRATLIRTMAANYIYCHGKEIEIDNMKVNCPTYPIKLPTSTAFRTDHIKYNPKVYKRVVTEQGYTIDSRPFRTYQTMPDSEEHAILHSLNDARALLKKAQDELEGSIIIPANHNSYWLMITVIIVLGAVGTYYGLSILYHHLKSNQVPKHTEEITMPRREVRQTQLAAAPPAFYPTLNGEHHMTDYSQVQVSSHVSASQDV